MNTQPETLNTDAGTKPAVRTIWVGVNGWGIHGSFQVPEKYTLPLMKWLAKRSLAHMKQPKKLSD